MSVRYAYKRRLVKGDPAMTWMVKAETHSGAVLVLKSGFESEDAALDGYKLRGKFYRRVWVEQAKVPSLWDRLMQKAE